MAHKVASVQSLYEDSCELLNNVVNGGEDSSARTIIDDLKAGCENLKQNWEGKDAGVQINNVITVLNAMIGIRNALASLAVESSKVAANYREIQNSNGAGLEQFVALSAENDTVVSEYSDDRDTINIRPDVLTGKQKIDKAKTSIESFISRVTGSYNKIIEENWTEGDANRDAAVEAFQTFLSNTEVYKEILNQAATSIETAIKNYNI